MIMMLLFLHTFNRYFKSNATQILLNSIEVFLKLMHPNYLNFEVLFLANKKHLS